MKIILFKAERVKNLTAVEIKPNGDVVLSGKNGQGKSNILNIIMSVLTGKKLDDPILHGAEDGECLIDTGEFKVMKKWTAKGEYIKVIMANGDIKAKPMEFLGGIIGKISFDPLEFATMDSNKQKELLKKLVGLDFSDIEKEYKETFDKRTGVNSQIKGVIAQLESAEAPHPDIPSDEILYKDEIEKLNVLRDKRTIFSDAVDAKHIIIDDLAECTQNITIMQDKIQQLEKEISITQQQGHDLQSKLDSVVLPPEVTQQQITDAESALQGIQDKNVKIRAANRYRTLAKDGNKLKQEADAFTENLKRLEQDKSTRISNAKMPIDGLSLSDDAVIYRGDPFSNLSTGHKTRVSTAISIALNPTLKIIFIRRWADLDSEGKKEVTDLAHANGYDVWAEVVDESGEIGYFISEGAIKAINGKEVPGPAQDAS